jgi:hypothetical protein
MASMPFAFSVHNFISSVGADAGFAAIIGLAVLVLLYFAHARETANLREEAGLLAERLQQAEARVAELSRPQSVTSPVPAPAAVQVTDRRGAGVALPFAPAGVGAPALAAATRVVPLPEPAPPARAPAPAMVTAGAPVAATAGAPVAATAAASGAPPFAPSPSVTSAPSSPSPAPSPSPLPARAPAPASRAPAGALPGPATPAGANGGSHGAPPVIAAPRGPAGAPRGDLPPLGPPSEGRRSLARRIVIGLVSLVLLAIAVAALIIVTSTKSTKSTPGPTQTTNAPVARRAPTFTPSSVTVAVLNGTATNQLAHRVAAKLASSGYKEGRIATAANQTEATTIVAYLPGSTNRTDALHVATALNLKPSAVQPIDQSTQQVACPPPTACGANVVVTVGADLTTLPGA